MDYKSKPSRVSSHDYFMETAHVVARRSTCLHRQVGAVLVQGKQIVSTGYNGAPSGHSYCLDIGCARQGVPSGQRSELCRAAHAEQNAINFAARFGISIEGATLYTTHYPCSWCAKSIVNAGIARVIYGEDYPDPLAKEILSAIQVQWIKALFDTETACPEQSRRDDHAPGENSETDKGNGN